MQGTANCISGHGLPNMASDEEVTRVHGWFQSAPAPDVPTGISAGTHFCVLSSVTGFFSGYGEPVNLTTDAKRQWVIQGQTAQEFTALGAWCFRYRQPPVR